MTTNARICVKNAVDDSRCVLSCSVSDILPVENLQNVVRERILRVAAGSDIDVKGTYGGESVRASMVSFYRHNLEAGATVRFRGYSDDAWTTLVIDTGDRDAVPTATLDYLDFGISPLGISIWDPNYRLKRTTVFFDDADMALFDSEIIGSWKATITDPSNTSGNIDLSRLWVGKYFELTYNPIYGAAIGLMDDSKVWRTDGGSARADAVVPYRGGKFDLQAFPEADRAMWVASSQYCGVGRRPFFFSLYPDNELPALTRDFEGEFIFRPPLPQMARVQGDARHSTAVTIEET